MARLVLAGAGATGGLMIDLEAAARCPVWARKACDPRTRGGGHWTRELEDGGWWVPGRKIGVGAGTDDEGDCGVTWRLGLGGES